MIRQAVPYGNNAVSKIIFPYVVMTVMLNKFKFITSCPVVYWGVYAGIRRIPTSGVFLTAYTHLSDHK